MEENNGITGTEIVMDGPFDSEGGFVGEIDGDADLALSVGGGGFGGVRSGGGRKAWRRRFDFD